MFYPEGFIACVVGGAGGFYVHHVTTRSERVLIVSDTISVLSMFLCAILVVFALFTMFSDKYLHVIIDANVGLSVFMRPFIVAIGMQVWTLLLAVIYCFIGTHVFGAIEHMLFMIWSFLFVYVLADFVALGRGLFAHGLTREKMLEIEKIKNENNIL